MSTFINHQSEKHLQYNKAFGDKYLVSESNQWQELFLSISPPYTNERLLESLRRFAALSGDAHDVQTQPPTEMEWAILSRIIVVVHAHVMQTCLREAIQADGEAEWWGRVERSQSATALYLIQTLPERLVRFAQSFTSLLRSQNLSLYRLSSNWQAIKNLVSSSAPLLLTSIFPHLSQERYAVYLRWRWDPRNVLELTRQECFLRRKELEGLRDSKAKALGKLADLSHLVKLSTVWRGQNDQSETMQSIVTVLTAVLGGKSEPTGTERSRSRSRARFLSPREFCATIQLCISERLPRFAESHDSTLARLYRPSRLTRIWPKVVFYPIVGLIAARYAYRSKDSVVTIARDALDTVRGFWTGWVVEPVTGIIRTVRTGGEDGPRVISKDGLNSDMESLERMVTSLVSEKFNYSKEQIDELTQQIRQGDLTPVLKLYEEDIKRPLKSVVVGSLIRTLFIQIQKTKVDIDFALAGIDKLLRSQELTFAFVGVAPSLVVLYIAGGWLRSLVFNGDRRKKGRFGGKRGREMSFQTMRRIERLLNATPQEHQPPPKPLLASPTSSISAPQFASPTLPPLTHGLLLLSLTHLRNFGEKNLPVRTRLREGFLEDVKDLEDPMMPRDRKLRVVELMWRSWGGVLGWDRVAS